MMVEQGSWAHILLLKKVFFLSISEEEFCLPNACLHLVPDPGRGMGIFQTLCYLEGNKEGNRIEEEGAEVEENWEFPSGTSVLVGGWRCADPENVPLPQGQKQTRGTGGTGGCAWWELHPDQYLWWGHSHCCTCIPRRVFSALVSQPIGQETNKNSSSQLFMGRLVSILDLLMWSFSFWSSELVLCLSGL